MNVREIMTENPACCPPDASLQQVAQMMVECDCGEIPIVESEQDKRVIGVITDRDITVRTVAQGRNPLELRARDCMSGQPITVTPDTDIDEAANLLAEHQVRRLPVVDEEGKLCGIVAQADIANALSSSETGEMVREVSQPNGNSLRAS